MENGYCVKWEKHHNAVVSVFDNLYKHNVLVDCTLAAENKFIKAHRIVLMACSPYFEDLLSQHSENYPILWMDMKFCELRSLIDFCYRGEVKLQEADLPGFLNAARLLQIKGLCETPTNKRKVVSEGGDSVKPKKKPRSSSPELVRPVNIGDLSHSLSPQIEILSPHDKRGHAQTNGSDRIYNSFPQGDSDNSDLDTDDDSSVEKDSIMLDDLLSGSSHMIYRWGCKGCGEAFPTADTYIDHRSRCVEERDNYDPDHPWKCERCPNGYKNKKDLVQHLYYCGRATERHVCDRCGNTYKYERGLKRHKIYCGTDVKPMVCGSCGKTYKYKRGLRRHQKKNCIPDENYMREQAKKQQAEAAAEKETRVSSVQANPPPVLESAPSKDYPPSVCKQCGKVYKYRKSYLHHLEICIYTEEESKKEGGELIKVEGERKESPPDEALSQKRATSLSIAESNEPVKEDSGNSSEGTTEPLMLIKKEVPANQPSSSELQSVKPPSSTGEIKQDPPEQQVESNLANQ